MVSLALSGWLYYRLRIMGQTDYVVVYFVRSTPTNFLLVPVVRACPGRHSGDGSRELAGPTSEENNRTCGRQYRPVPKCWAKVADGLASVNFSRTQTNFVGGSQRKGAWWMPLSHLVQFPEIERIEILIEGERAESIAGHVLIEYHLP